MCWRRRRGLGCFINKGQARELEVRFYISAAIEHAEDPNRLYGYPKGNRYSAEEAGGTKSGQQVIAAGSLIGSGGKAVAFRNEGCHIRLRVGWRACVGDVTLDIEEVRFRAFRVDDTIGHQVDF